MNITVVGTGYVGLVTGVALGLAGHTVYCVGRNKEKIQRINQGGPPFFEPGLPEALSSVIRKKNFLATDKLRESIVQSEITIIAVGTPTVNGKIDLTEMKAACRDVGKAIASLHSYHVIVVKSTVTPGTTERIVKPILEQLSGKETGEFGLCMNPEFLREGNAMTDALHPDRVIIGQYDAKSGSAYAKAYHESKCPIVFMNLGTAEMIKYVSNSLLSTLISYSNEIGRICEKTPGVDVVDVWKGLHLDGRLSPVIDGKRIEPGILRYIYSGCGYGGSCFPKDTKALLHYAKTIHIDTPLLKGSIAINATQPLKLVVYCRDALGSLKGKRIAVLGLAFKPNTDDIRESPGIFVIQELVAQGAKVICHDPQAYKENIPKNLINLSVYLAKTVQEALRDADGAILITAWEEYTKLTPQFFKQYMKNAVVIDGRRIFDKGKFEKAGIVYKGIGLGI